MTHVYLEIRLLEKNPLKNNDIRIKIVFFKYVFLFI